MAEIQYLTVPHLSIKEITRIFSKISVNEATGCWEWTGGLNRGGYGKIKYHGKDLTAHRLMYAWIVGPIPVGLGKDILQLDHIVCDNRRCCFPAHIKLATIRENTLRGRGQPAINARKMHCIRGHLLPKTTVSWGGRECPICRKVWHQSERYLKWNRQFGSKRHKERRYGPERERLLAKWRENVRRFHANNPDKQREYNRKAYAKRKLRSRLEPEVAS